MRNNRSLISEILRVRLFLPLTVVGSMILPVSGSAEPGVIDNVGTKAATTHCPDQIRIKEGTYTLKWQDLSVIGDNARMDGLRDVSSDDSPIFIGSNSPNARWAQTDHFVAVLDETGGAGKGYDMLYLLPRPRSNKVAPREKLDLPDARKIPLRSYHPRITTNRRPLTLRLWPLPLLEPVEDNITSEFRFTVSGKTITRKSDLDIAVYDWKGTPGFIKIALKSGWIGTLETNTGPRTVAPIDSNFNGVYGESRSSDADEQRWLPDEILLEMERGSGETIRCDEPLTYGADVYTFNVSPDGSKVTVKSDGGKEQAKVKAFAAGFVQALRSGNTGTLDAMMSESARKEFEKRPAEGAIKADETKPSWQSIVSPEDTESSLSYLRGPNVGVRFKSKNGWETGLQLSNWDGKLLIEQMPYEAWKSHTASCTPPELKVVELLPRDGVISANEPLVAKMQLTNTTKEEMDVNIGASLSDRVEVYGKSGELVGATPLEPLAGSELSSGFRLAPGESRVRWVVLSALYQFDVPGDYTLRIQMLNVDETRTVLTETKSHVRVLPFDHDRLAERCKEIYAPLSAFPTKGVPNNLDSFPMRTRLQALYSVHNDAVLPYLSLLATEWDNTSEQWPAMKSISRIDSPAAKALYDSLTGRTGHVAEVARSAANVRDSYPDEWYIGDEWHSPP